MCYAVKIRRVIIALLLLQSSSVVFANTIVKDIRMWHAPERSRIVLDLNQSPAYKYFSLAGPRVVVDIAEAKIQAKIPAASEGGQYIRRIRSGSPKANTVRLVFDLKKQVRYKVFPLQPNGFYSHRLVIDFYPASGAVKKPTKSPSQPIQRKPKSELVILIDPGHGGEDSGAKGKRTTEKKVVLQIAKRLKSRIDKTHLDNKTRLRAVLTRTGDYYISLRKRTNIALKHQADIFISIHADAFKTKAARGASVYALSLSGASNEEARRLANRENESDLAGGVSLADRPKPVAELLLDLSMQKTMSESISFGRDVLAQLKKVGKVHSKRVERAGFGVLKSPDIPSILIETAYITNPTEERLLMNPKHQERIVAALVTGITTYINKNRGRYDER